MLSVVALVCSFFISQKLPILTDDAKNWMHLVKRSSRDILQTISMVGGAIIVAAFVPQVGLWFERIVLRSPRWAFLAVTVGLSIISSAWFAYDVMDRRTHIVDESAMLFQAEVLASGRLYAKAPPVPEAFDYEFIIVDGPKWYGKYFIGQSLFLVPGVWLGVPWLMHPLLIGACVWLTYVLGRDLLNEKIARIAAILMVFSPLRLYIGGTMMGHASSLFMLLVFAVATLKVVRDPKRWGWGLVAGGFLGLACNARPLTVVGMAGAMGIAAMIAIEWRRLSIKTVVAFSAALAIGVGIFFAYNKALTGSATLTPFNKWSANDRLGFGPEVGLEYWRKQDKGHTLYRGLFVDAYQNSYYIGSSVIGWGDITWPLLLLPLVLVPPWMAASPTVRKRWRGAGWTLSAVWLSLAFVHVFHVSSGELWGQPRYWSEALPEMILLIAITLAMARVALPRVCRQVGIFPAVRTGRSAVWLTGVMLVVASWYIGHRQLINKSEIFVQVANVPRLAANEGNSNALVFMKTGSFRTVAKDKKGDEYLNVFMENNPNLTSPVIYARDLGPAKNAELAKHFLDRKLYWLGRDKLDGMKYHPVDHVGAIPVK